jgi:hypothetical protein
MLNGGRRATPDFENARTMRSCREQRPSQCERASSVGARSCSRFIFWTAWTAVDSGEEPRKRLQPLADGRLGRLGRPPLFFLKRKTVGRMQRSQTGAKKTALIGGRVDEGGGTRDIRLLLTLCLREAVFEK